MILVGLRPALQHDPTQERCCSRILELLFIKEQISSLVVFSM